MAKVNFTLKNLKSLKWKGFKPYLNDIESTVCSCGGAICSILTGIPVKCIHLLHPDNEDWSESWVKTFLGILGYVLVDVPSNFDELRKDFDTIFGDEHVIVAVLGITKKEASWAVIHGDKVHHGQNQFGGMKSGSVLVNFPIQKLWVCVPLKQYQKIYKNTRK